MTPPARCVIIGAHHTTGWDLPIGLVLNWAGNLKLRWMAKESIFRFPLGRLLTALGGIPVKRHARGNFVEQMAATFSGAEALRLGLTPEGTRAYTDHWKTGFYYIALKAQVPIVMAYADFPRRVAGIGPSMMPTGDIEADFEIFRRFYATITGRYPERHGEIRPSPTAAARGQAEP
ncbi:MAG: 1-acyl-sn-glycerol-3-phosphate acyltransferase [Anaerolineales bacterium]